MDENLIKKIKNGEVFIYPTDSVYGLGCNAFNLEGVKRIKTIKERDADKPMSVIAPNVDWILENLEVNRGEIEKYLPGRFTLILKKKDKRFLNHVSSGSGLGVRIPDHEFVKNVEKAGVPFITTSVNLSGERPAVELSDIDNGILEKVDEVVDGGKLFGKPSSLVIDGKVVERR
jgi:L-threonylcarbamoyladenylate synthase